MYEVYGSTLEDFRQIRCWRIGEVDATSSVEAIDQCISETANFPENKDNLEEYSQKLSNTKIFLVRDPEKDSLVFGQKVWNNEGKSSIGIYSSVGELYYDLSYTFGGHTIGYFYQEFEGGWGLFAEHTDSNPIGSTLLILDVDDMDNSVYRSGESNDTKELSDDFWEYILDLHDYRCEYINTEFSMDIHANPPTPRLLDNTEQSIAHNVREKSMQDIDWVNDILRYSTSIKKWGQKFPNKIEHFEVEEIGE